MVRRSDQGYSSDQDLAGEPGLAARSHYHKYTAAGSGDRTGAVKAGTLKPPAMTRNPSVL